jgi:hypothetical protein
MRSPCIVIEGLLVMSPPLPLLWSLGQSAP